MKLVRNSNSTGLIKDADVRFAQANSQNNYDGLPISNRSSVLKYLILINFSMYVGPATRKKQTKFKWQYNSYITIVIS